MRNNQEFIGNYVSELNNALSDVPADDIDKVIKILLDANKSNKNIFIFGNGGSAATSSHFANDLNKLCSVKGKKRFKAFSLADSIPVMTAWANDDGYGLIFVEQLKNLMEEGDICIAISGSGNSENVLKAVEYAKGMKGTTIALVGFDGGKLKDAVDRHILVRSRHYGIIEDIHLSICHIIANCIKDAAKSDGGHG